MNQKNYKEIARIMRNNIEADGDLSPRIVKELSDYFERESECIDCCQKSFNKKQFLKDCGVK